MILVPNDHKNHPTRYSLAIVILLLLTTLARTTENTRIPQFWIKTLKQGSVDTTASLASQNPAQGIERESAYTGNLVVSWKSDKITAEVYYREKTEKSHKSTKVLTITFPFKRESSYELKDLLYTPQSSEKFKIEKNGIKHQKVDKELYLFPGPSISPQYALEAIRANLEVQVLSDSEGGESYHPKINFLEFYYSEQNSVHHILIDKAMFGKKDLSGVVVTIVVILGILITLGGPIFHFLFYFGFFGETCKSVNFSGTQIHQISFVVSFLILLKLVSGLTATLAVFLATFVLFAVKFGPTYSWIVHFKEAKLGGRQKMYVAAVAVLNIAWLVAVWFNFRIILRSMFFYSFLVLVDLSCLQEVEGLRPKPVWKVWTLVMGQQVLNMVSCYVLYFYLFWDVYTSSPPILPAYILPDAVLLLLMLIPFSIRLKIIWNGKTEKKKIWKHEKVSDAQSSRSRGKSTRRRPQSTRRGGRVIQSPGSGRRSRIEPAKLDDVAVVDLSRKKLKSLSVFSRVERGRAARPSGAVIQ